MNIFHRAMSWHGVKASPVCKGKGFDRRLADDLEEAHGGRARRLLKLSGLDRPAGRSVRASSRRRGSNRNATSNRFAKTITPLKTALFLKVILTR